MANKKSENNSSNTTNTTETNKKNRSFPILNWGINQISFWLIVSTAVFYLVSMILHYAAVSSALVDTFQAIASAIMICVVAVLAFRYVKNKQIVWKILYAVTLFIVLVCIVLPILL